MGEAGFLTHIGTAHGFGLLYLLLLVAQPSMESMYGIFIAIGGPSNYELLLLGALVLAGFFVGSIPAYRAYRYSLANGLSIRI